jgi:hypothetical protein
MSRFAGGGHVRGAAAGLAALLAGCMVEFPSRTVGDAGASPGPSLDALVGQGQPGLQLDLGSGGADGFTGTGPRPPQDARLAADAAAGGAFVKPDAGRPDPDAAPTPDAAADAAPSPDAAGCRPAAGGETCDGRDEDCDGDIDEGARCGAFVQSHCRAWLVWANNAGPGPLSDTWGDCPGQPEDIDLWWHASSIGCNSTRADGRFRPVPLSGNVDSNDWLGVAFTCDSAAGPAAPWFQAQCRIFLGQADVVGRDVQPDDADSWAACPAANESVPGPLQCVGSGGDGRFHAMRLFGDVDGTDRLSIAFRCDAAAGAGAAEQRRAAAMTAAVRIFLTYTYWYPQEDGDGWDTWGDCPGADRDAVGDERCVSSARDGRFHAVSLDGIQYGNLDFDDTLGIGLLAADD